MANTDDIRITGAREHNLRDLTLNIPKGKITVFTGVSGSGKSSIVFDTVAVESQRQLNETFTWFVRNRLPKYERPKADTIDRLSPAIVVDQRPIGGSARSTVGTMTDIYSILRVLYSRVGRPSAGEATVYSFNDPAGMCPECDGLGRTFRLDLDRLVDTSKSLNGGAILFPPMAVGTVAWQYYAESGLFDPDLPLRDFPADKWELFLYGKGFTVKRRSANATYNNTYWGLAENFDRLYLKRDLSSLSDKTRETVRRFVTEGVCPECGGARLNKAALATRVAGLGIAEMAALEVGELITVLAGIDDPVGTPIATRAVSALRRIEDIGLGYLSLDRETPSLSGGEGQRLKTVRHLGSSLTGMTYIFDEPSIGLHPRDVHRLNDLLRRLRDKGNTVLVVEHDRDVITTADHVIDMGPGAGTHGGEIVFEGTVEALAEADTPTGRGLRRPPSVKDGVRRGRGRLDVPASRLHNLKGVGTTIPEGVLTVVTGVAGSGKSSLVSGVFAAAHPAAIIVDQSSIGISARSTPATYIGAMDRIRKVFADEHGVKPGMFSFNSAGACPECGGRGEIYTDLAFMDPVRTTCEACGGRRFNDEVLAMTVRGKSIADVLDMTAEEAAGFVEGLPGAKAMSRGFGALVEVGLSYVSLGQSVSTLSGGERQRLKLATRLREDGAIYVLDEPTTGLHMSDVDGLVGLLDRLVDDGNTVVVIEHNLDVIARADWIVDLGPDGGRRGGEIVFTGTPRELLSAEGSVTGECLRAAVG
ncbi:ATP-binding cassette domain-containing protein [Phytomonospora endophytica]|uniref:UvrABC system protein A n=1 Tax=Phytomonospora endophytica TaxID=714109 RepID=A0A841FBW9_9ACTN|nr:excinuclease ABC subunit UvrA [Phytomonospora endophytica]MBB6034781.1 excinuclease UvrABC ATPase subunit [Phytomonospora endophytica]GIG69016.1 thiamine ABC transporter permease [Phytomonospora endophytica]